MTTSTVPTVYLAIPHYGDVKIGTALAMAMAAASRTCRVIIDHEPGSVLPHVFNKLWCRALNRRIADKIDFWLMMHADVCPIGAFVDTMVAEQKFTSADVLGCAIPIKDDRGVSSTALDYGNGTIQRLTMHEVNKLPWSFGAEYAASNSGWSWSRDHDSRTPTMLVNTGLMLVDFRKPWVEPPCFTGFRFTSEIRREENGQFEAYLGPEDWNFSRDVARISAKLPLKVMATRRVTLKHHGDKGWDNSTWGTWQTDKLGSE